MGLLTETLRGIIEGPLGEYGVTVGTVNERVAAIRQHERRLVFGVSLFRDGDDHYFIGEEDVPVTKRGAAEAVQGALQSQGRLLGDDGQPLDEKLSAAALRAMQDQEKAAQEQEAQIGAAFKKLGSRYAEALSKMSGKDWKVASATADILSLDSEDKRAVDIYWEADPGTNTATIYVEGPKGKRQIYRKQRLTDIPKRNYIDWLKGVLGEEMKHILGLVMMEMAEPEEVFEHAAIMEEVEAILAEYEVYRKRSYGKAPVRGDAGGAKANTPKVVSSRTKIAALFKRLLLALKRGGDYNNVIWLLRKEDVPESDISFAIRRLRMPMAYAESEDIDGDVLDEGEWVEAEEADLYPFDQGSPDRIEELTGEGGRFEGGGETFQQWFNKTKGYDLRAMRKLAMQKGYADLTGASKPDHYKGVGEIIGYMLMKGRPTFVLDDQWTLRDHQNIKAFTLGLHLGLGEGPALEPAQKTKWEMKRISSGKTGRKGWRIWVSKAAASKELPSKAVMPKGLGKGKPYVGPERRAVKRAPEPNPDFTKTKIIPKPGIRAAS
jgi:hypothetical protein